MTRANRRIVWFTGAAIILTSLLGIAPSNAAVVSFSGVRPFKLFIPTTYNREKPAPLILALHGYTSSGDELEKYLNFTAVAQARGILYVHPDGTADGGGNTFWNATPACCNFYSAKVDDQTYLMSIINAVSKKYAVDPRRIYVIGHSNGGFMSQVMACNHADRIAAIVSLAGATYENPSTCKPTAPISVLQIWGTADQTIMYQGGEILGNAYPGASQTVASWATLDRCSKKITALPQKLDLEAQIKGNETAVGVYKGCAAKTTVELWTIAGGQHVPSVSATFATKVVDFLLAHPKSK
jgi:polyhydroxybutyrate depolymerase